MAEGDVRRRDVDPELHAQRPIEGELRLRPPSGSTCTAFFVRSASPIEINSMGGNRPALVSANGRGETTPTEDPQARLLALLLVLGLVGIASFAFGLVTAIAGELPRLDPARYRPDKNSVGRPCARRAPRRRGPIVVKSEEIADVMKQAIVAIEDRFFEHRGIDVRGIARAIWQDLRTALSSRAARRSPSSS